MKQLHVEHLRLSRASGTVNNFRSTSDRSLHKFDRITNVKLKFEIDAGVSPEKVTSGVRRWKLTVQDSGEFCCCPSVSPGSGLLTFTKAFFKRPCK